MRIIITNSNIIIHSTLTITILRSLGVVLYELLALQPPFNGGSLQESGGSMIISEHKQWLWDLRPSI